MVSKLFYQIELTWSSSFSSYIGLCLSSEASWLHSVQQYVHPRCC